NAAAAAPAQSAAAQSAAGNYRGQVIAHLARFKRSPEGARARQAEGVPVVAFTLDGSGRVTGAGLSRSSGHADIDAEALAMVRRAVPFPAPPPGAGRSFSASIGFRLR
ncbi:MAG: energy transducer TonB, partial [Microvirga sp.]